MNFDLEKNTIFLAVHGSHAYGLSTDKSDLDVRGIAIPPKNFLFSPFKKFEQAEFVPEFVKRITKDLYPNVKNETDDCVIFSLLKFVLLASQCNPNVIELLFLPDRVKLFSTKYWEIFEQNRNLFVSLRAKHSFLGYAFAQLKKLRNHKKWVDNPPVKPDRKGYGLPEHKIGSKDFVNSLIHIGKNADVKIGDDLFAMAQREQRYSADMDTWHSYEIWRRDRNKDRAVFEKKFGYDLKAAGHLVRLVKMGEEILKTGKVNVDRTNIDAEELRGIKNDGLWPYDQLMQFVEDSEARIELLYKENPMNLPYSNNNEDRIEKLTIDIIEKFYEEQC